MVPATVVCGVGAPVLLGLFGGRYAAEGVATLRLLSLAALPLSLNLLFLTKARLDRDMRWILGITIASGGGALLLGAMLAAQLGVDGIALGYLAAHTAVAVPLTIVWRLREKARS